MASSSAQNMKQQLAQFSLRCTSESFLRCNPCPSTKSAFQPPDVRHRHRQCQFGSWRWRQGSPFLPAAGWCGCRHQWQRQGQGKAGDDDGQCSVAASSDIGHCLLHQGSRLLLVDLTSPMESGLLLSVKVALFLLIIGAASAPLAGQGLD